MIKVGAKAKDTLTGFKGNVVAITEWLNGCRRLLIQAEEVNKDGKIIEHWFDGEQVKEIEKRKKSKPKLKAVGGPQRDPSR